MNINTFSYDRVSTKATGLRPLGFIILIPLKPDTIKLAIFEIMSSASANCQHYKYKIGKLELEANVQFF